MGSGWMREEADGEQVPAHTPVRMKSWARAGCGTLRPSDVVLGVPLVAGPLHREVPVQVLHLALLLDEVLADPVEGHDEGVPVLAVHLLLEGDLVPLEVAVLALVAVLDCDRRQLQHLLELLLGDVDALLPVVDVLVREVDLAPRVLGLADRDLDHGWRKSARRAAARWQRNRGCTAAA